MPTRPRIILSEKEFENSAIATNHVLVEMKYSSDKLRTHAGIHIGFNSEEIFAVGMDDKTAHAADVAEIWGIVTRVPDRLVFDKDDPLSMDWECGQELQKGDQVFFNVLESKNANEVQVGNTVYRSIPYRDCIVTKRTIPTMGADTTVNICLNGFVLCTPCYMPKLGSLDAVSDTLVDKTRGKIAYIGNPVKSYLREEYCHIEDLRVGDEVLFDKKAPLYMLERLKETAVFPEWPLWVVQRRRIAMLLNR